MSSPRYTPEFKDEAVRVNGVELRYAPWPLNGSASFAVAGKTRRRIMKQRTLPR